MRDILPVRVDFHSERLAPAPRVEQTPPQQFQVLPGCPVHVRGHLPALDPCGASQGLKRAILANLDARHLQVPLHSRPREHHPASLRAQLLGGGAPRQLVGLERPRGNQLVTPSALGGASKLAVFHPVSLQIHASNHGGALLGQLRVFPDRHQRVRDVSFLGILDGSAYREVRLGIRCVTRHLTHRAHVEMPLHHRPDGYLRAASVWTQPGSHSTLGPVRGKPPE
mmetsp:Transcript_1345/g.5838  ORF Transcript_1345/g.5838 Transcript_1345/m.5838 type:complete len:225 (-) Transcript_1345:719-1393(-)